MQQVRQSLFFLKMTSTPHLGVFVLALILASTTVFFVNTDFVWLSGMGNTLNDQVAYISTARAWGDIGELRSAIVYPSLLLQDVTANHPYMPGHYLALAASYWVWGYSPLASFFPNLIAYLVAGSCLLLIATRLHDRITGILSSIILLTFPAVLSYSCTAMAEITFLAAGLVAFALFLLVPKHLRPYLGPFLLLLPVFFRETGALVVIPMVSVMMSDRSSTWKRDTVVMVVLSVLFVSVLVFGIFGDRPSFMKLNLIEATFSQKYMNAFNGDQIDLSPSQWAYAALERFIENWNSLLSPRDPIPLFERLSLWFILFGMPLGFVLGIVRRDVRLLGYSMMSAGVFALLLATYVVWGYVGLRNMLICMPFVAMVYSRTMVVLCPRAHQRKLIASTLICGVLVAFVGVRTSFGTQDGAAQVELRLVSALEGIHHDDDQLLVSPFWALPYVSTHYPVQWSFVPANIRTLRLLEETYEIGSMLVALESPLTTLTQEEIEADGFVPVSRINVGRQRLLLFRKSAEARERQREIE